MKFTNRRSLIGLLAVLLAATAVWVQAQLADDRPLPSLLPPGAMLYLEAKDFHRLLTEWNGSEERQRWLGSKNVEQLAVSRLIQRLGQAGGEFGAASGVPVGMALTDEVAGARSGFAFYNFSDVAFVYITQLPQNRIEASQLWKQRAGAKTRSSGGVPFYVKTDEKSDRAVAFCSYKGWFVVATDEHRMAETLVLLSGGKVPSLANQDWFASAAGQRKEQGDLRLVYDMAALLKSPQYRTYWPHRNASELRPFRAGVADLFEREDGFTEERVMVRTSEIPAPPLVASLADAAAYAPSGVSSLLRAWSSPDRAQIASAVQQVLLGEPAPAGAGTYEPAPTVTPETGSVGSESDLEIRIDQAPFERTAQQSLSPVINALMAMQPLALAHVQLTTILRDQVFVVPQSGVVLVCQQPDRAALDRALADATGELQTGSLDPLLVSHDGRSIVLSRVPLTRGTSGLTLAAGTTYAAVYDHQSEWPRYKKLFSVLDQAAGATQPGAPAATPAFFSGNIGSLGDSLPRLQRASIVSLDRGATVQETVHYQMGRL